MHRYWSGAERQLSAEGAPRSLMKFGSLLLYFGLVLCCRRVHVNVYRCCIHTDTKSRGKKCNSAALVRRFKSSSIGQDRPEGASTPLRLCPPRPPPTASAPTGTPQIQGFWALVKNNNANSCNSRSVRTLFCPE